MLSIAAEVAGGCVLLQVLNPLAAPARVAPVALMTLAEEARHLAAVGRSYGVSEAAK